jgi:hypothetical protein
MAPKRTGGGARRIRLPYAVAAIVLRFAVRQPDAAFAAPCCGQVAAVRGWRSEGPVVFLTARPAEVDRIVGLELGADDCVGKPLQEQRQDWTKLLAQGTGNQGLVIVKTMSPTKRLNDSFSTNCL